jgi:hypothetical protein
MKASLALGAALLACAGCTSGILAGPSTDGGGPEAHVVDEAGTIEAGPPDDSGPVDGSAAPQDAISEPQPFCLLAPPSFAPPGQVISPGSSVTILPPPGFPPGGQIFYMTNGAVPTANNGSLYIGPIQITFPYGATETVIAIAHDPTGACDDSLPGTAVYKEEGPDG